MKTPAKPLFIIDESQVHGRGEDTTWISCTSSSLPFVAMVQFISDMEYMRQHTHRDEKTIYSESVNGVRMMARVTNIADQYDPTVLRTLLRKLMKEMKARKAAVSFTHDAPSDAAVLRFIEILQGQNRENLRAEPDNRIHRNVFVLLEKLHEDYLGKLS